MTTNFQTSTNAFGIHTTSPREALGYLSTQKQVDSDTHGGSWCGGWGVITMQKQHLRV